MWVGVYPLEIFIVSEDKTTVGTKVQKWLGKIIGENTEKSL